MEMVEQQPVTSEGFLQLSGVGEAKRTKYAESFLAIIAHYQQRATETEGLSSTMLKSFTLLENGLSLKDVAQQR